MNRQVKQWLGRMALPVLEMRVRELSYDAQYLDHMKGELAREAIAEAESRKLGHDEYRTTVKRSFQARWRAELAKCYDDLVRRLHENESTLWTHGAYEKPRHANSVPIEPVKVAFQQYHHPQPSGRMLSVAELWEGVSILGENARAALERIIEDKARLAMEYLRAGPEKHSTIMAEMAVTTLLPIYNALENKQLPVVNVPSVEELQKEVRREYGGRKAG